MKFFARITRMSMPVALLLSAVVMCGWIPSFLTAGWKLVLPAMLPVVFNGLLFWMLMMHAGVVRGRDGLPLFMFLLPPAVFPACHICWQGQTAVTCMLIVLLLLHKAFREEEPAEGAFVIALLLLIASLVLPDMVWLIPVVWIAYIILHSFGLRVWSATLISVALFAVYFLIAYYSGWIGNPYTMIFSRVWLFDSSPLSDAVEEVALIGNGIVLSVASLVRVDRDSIGQQNRLLLFILFYVACAGLSLFPVRSAATAIVPCCGSIFPVLLMLFSGLSVLFFRQRESVARGITYIVWIVLCVLCYFV